MHRILSKSKPMEDKTGRQNTPHYILRNSRDPCLGYIECGASNAAQEQDYGRQDKRTKHDSTGQRFWQRSPKLYGKCRTPRPRHALCASLRNRNALGDFTRATLYGDLQVKCRGPAGAPWSSTGLFTYRKNPSVWTHCLGKNMLSAHDILTNSD